MSMNTSRFRNGSRCASGRTLAEDGAIFPEVGMVVPRHLDHRRTTPHPTQLTYEHLSGPMAPSSYIQELIILELGQIGVSVLELVAEL